MSLFSRILEHKLFKLSLYIKAAYGFFEYLAGLLALLTSSRTIGVFIQKLFGQELIEDPHDIVGNFFMGIASNLTLRLHTFVALYLIVHGFVSIGIAAALLLKKKWLYPVVGILLGVFVLYQIYEIIRGPSLLLAISTLFDCFILLLMHLEYKRFK